MYRPFFRMIQQRFVVGVCMCCSVLMRNFFLLFISIFIFFFHACFDICICFLVLFIFFFDLLNSSISCTGCCLLADRWASCGCILGHCCTSCAGQSLKSRHGRGIISSCCQISGCRYSIWKKKKNKIDHKYITMYLYFGIQVVLFVVYRFYQIQ